MNKNEFLELLEKYLSGQASEEEREMFLNLYESYQTNDNWDAVLGPEQLLEVKMRDRLQKAISSESNKVIKLQPYYSRTNFRIVVAAAVVLLFFIGTFIKTKNTSDEVKTVAQESVIKIGSDKATLTLEDGSVVALEKGQQYKKGNVSSNGEQLVYNSNKSVPKIANNFLTIPRGGQFFVQLADSTKVWLNSESQLKFPVAFVDGQLREVELIYGEAYFEVSPSSKHKGSKFKVKTQAQNVEVYGTQFNVKAYKNEPMIYTTLVEGKVAVGNSKYKEVLAPNEQSKVAIADDKISISKVDVYNETSWRKGLFVFKGTSLQDIANVLSRWYDVDFEFEDLAIAKVKFNGVLNKDQKLEEILSTIKIMNAINAYEIKNHRVKIK